jgi:hypothetical protein
MIFPKIIKGKNPKEKTMKQINGTIIKPDIFPSDPLVI